MHKKTVPKILLLFTGGTITMIKNDAGVLVPARKIEDITNTFALMKQIAHLESELIADMDSSNMTPEIWQKLAQRIYANYHDYDGFVITHGTDTLAYTASALSLALPNLHKPVILTGAQKPISLLGSDSHFNLFNSVKVAAEGKVREVAIVFDTRILRGNRCSKKYAHKIDAFWSPQFPMIGEVGIEIKYFSYLPPAHLAKHKLLLQDHFDPNIVSLNLFPGFAPPILDALLAGRLCHGVILRGFGLGNVNTENDLVSIIRKATDQEIPVLLISSCPGGTTHLGLYDTGSKTIQAGAISAKDMTLECATVKLMWALAKTRRLGEIREIMAKNLAGETGADMYEEGAE